MSRRMSFSRWLWIVGWLFFAATLKADPPQGEPTPAKAVLFEVKVYEVDHSQLPSNGDSQKVQAAFDELLRPWLDGWRGSKLEKGNVMAWATKGAVSASDVEKRNGSVRLVSEPKLVVHDGEIGSFDYGGKTPQIQIYEGNQGSSRTTPLAGTFALESAVTESGRVFVAVFFDQHGSLRKKRSTAEELRQNGLKVNSELSVGQTLCLSDARFNSNHTKDSLLVTITPVEIKTLEGEQRVRAVAAEPAKPKELEITVEDRWPLGDITVGQRVIAIPVTIEKSSLQADITALTRSLYSKTPQRVTRIEPLPKQAGRRVTVSVPFAQEGDGEAQLKAIIENYTEGARTSTSTFVIPASTVSQADLWNGRPVQEIYDHIPAEFRPRPVELTIGETFTAIGVSGLMGESKTGTHHEIGPLTLNLIDDDAGGFWRATATKIGMTRLIQYAVGADMIGPVRLTEYLVKADTRELELHIRQQFPSAKVAITSVGAGAVMLKGTVTSDEDATGIVELAEQFAPKVLNRLKIGATNEAASTLEPRRMGTPARPIQPASAEEPPGTGNPPKADHPTKQKSNNLRELRDEIRELRQEVRQLIERLDREQAAMSKTSDDAKPWIKLGQTEETWRESQFAKLVLEFNELKEQKRFAEAKVVVEKAKAVAQVPPAEVNDKAWQMLGVHVATLSEAETKQLGPKYRGGMKVTVLRPDGPATQNRIRQGDILVGLHVWETCSFENLNFVLMHPQLATMRKLKFYILRGTETLFGDLPLATTQPTPAATTDKSLSLQPAVAGLTEAERAAVEKMNAIVKLEASNLPLRKVIQQFGTSADVNIVLDTAGLEEAGVTAETPVSLNVSNVKLRSALTLLLHPLQLGHVFDGEVLKITSRERAAGPPVVVAYPVGDLLGAGEAYSELHGLRQLIMATVGNEKQWIDTNPSVPKIHCDGATKSLVVRHTQSVHGELAGFLELLRRTKRVVPAKNGTATLSEEEQRIIEQLRMKISVYFEQTPLKQVLEHFAKQSDINVVLDVAGLQDVAMTPRTPVSLNLDQVRLSTTLRLLLEPLQLDYVVKNDVLQITSRQRAEGELVVTTYTVPDLIWREGDPSGDLSDLCDMLMSMVQPNSWEIAGGPAAVRGNLPTRSLVVRQTRANQARIRELLETMRKLTDRRETSAANKSRTSRTPPPLLAANPVRRVEKEKDHEIADRLKTKVSVHFENVPLSKLLEHLSREAKIDIVLDDKGLTDESLTPTTPVSLSVADIPLQSVLTLLLEPLNLSFVIEPNGLKVTNERRAKYGPIVATYPVADLVVPIETLSVNLSKSGAATTEKQPIDGNAHTKQLTQLVELITSAVAPNSWAEVGGEGLIKTDLDTLSLVVRQAPAAHDEIRDLLEQLRRLHDLQVSFELRVLKFDAGFPGVSSSLPEGWNAASDKKPLLLSAEQSAVLLKAANSSDHRNSLWQAPKITLLNGQRVLLSTDTDSPVSPLRVTATHAISADRESVRMSLAADAGSSNYSITSHVPNGQSLLFNVTDTPNDGTQTGIPILSKVPNADRLFKNVTKSALKPGESLFLLATPRVIDVEDSDKAEVADSASDQK